MVIPEIFVRLKNRENSMSLSFKWALIEVHIHTSINDSHKLMRLIVSNAWLNWKARKKSSRLEAN
jgi:hypothetical protein